MSGDLTTSAVARQNILNNPYALEEIEKAAGLRGIAFEGTHVVLKEQVADFFEVTTRTVDNYLRTHADELGGNGYELLKGKRLKSLKDSIVAIPAHEINFVSTAKITQLGVFNFRAFLNLAMLLSESERARVLRQAILDVAIDIVNRRTGGVTKSINQRDDEYLQLSGGGAVGALDLGRLQSVLENIQNDDWYPELADKLTHLFFGIAKFHCFQDGNKRTAITACAHMLLVNGYLYCVKAFLHDMENISVQVADDTISKELLREIIVAQLERDTDNEELKLKILEAITAKAPNAATGE